MLGNDVVDLRDPEAMIGATHPRFDTRVFAEPELAALEQSGSRERLRWALWAAKESAFKAARKLDPRIWFSPRRFEVELEDGAPRTVLHEGLRLAVHMQHHDDAVHAVSIAASAPPTRLALRSISAMERIEERGTDLSAAVRRLAIDRLAARLDVDPQRLAIARRGRIPLLLVDRRPSPIELSLSHHGAVIAFAALLPEPS